MNVLWCNYCSKTGTHNLSFIHWLYRYNDKRNFGSGGSRWKYDMRACGRACVRKFLHEYVLACVRAAEVLWGGSGGCLWMWVSLFVPPFPFWCVFVRAYLCMCSVRSVIWAQCVVRTIVRIVYFAQVNKIDLNGIARRPLRNKMKYTLL